METAIEFEPLPTRCRACEGTGIVQCDRCLLADSECDCCGGSAEVLVRDFPGDLPLPLCLACSVEAA